MNGLLKKYCPRLEFDSYEDFKQNYRINVPEDFNFGFDVVDEYARTDPDKLALVWTDDSGEVRRFTFGDVSRESNRAANYLSSKRIKKGDVVMLILKQHPEVWFLMTALCKLGAVCIPASFQLTVKDIIYRANSAGVKFLITVDDAELLRYIGQALPECDTLREVALVGEHIPAGMTDYRAEAAAFPAVFERPAGMKASDDMLIYFSSGTTGLPKMVLHNNTLPLGHIVTAKFWQCVRDGGIHLTQTDSGWAKFAWGKIYGQWLSGSAIGAYDTEKFFPSAMLAALARIRPTTFCAPATIYRFLIKEDLSGYDFSFIEHASLAGEPLNPEVFTKIRELTGLTIHEGFGQSESSVLIANFPWIDIKPGSMGKPAPDYDIDLLDEDGRSCEDGIVGTICVKNTDKAHPTGLFQEYNRAPEANAKAWKDGVYTTGDTAWRDADGYYWFEGRNDDVIKCSGYRIGPFEVESALLTHPSVLECAVTAVPDEIRGQIVKATVVLIKGCVRSDELKKELQEHVKKTTAPYKYPRIVEFTDELPKTISGKIKRATIRNQTKNDR